jgi:PAS domain S-box-containing protein/putative nucleotidyltransferase with HDIG domain
MRTLLVGATALMGWVLAGSYIMYDYGEYGPDIFRHIVTPETFASGLFHFFVLTAPGVSGLLAFLLNERMKLLDSVRDLEERYRDYYENAPQGYHSASADGRLLEVNATWLGMLGYERGEVVGRLRLFDLVEDGRREEFEHAHENFLRTGEADGIETVFIRKDGTRLPVLLSATALYAKDGSFERSRTIVSDNSELKEYEAALMRAAEEWKVTFDSMPWGVMLLDRDFKVVRTNEYMAGLADGPYAGTADEKCHHLAHWTDGPEEDRTAVKGHRSGGAEMSEYHDAESDRYFRVYRKPIVSGGKVLNYVHSVVDISDIRKGEKKLLDSRKAYFNMLKDGTQAFRDLSELHTNLVLAFANAIDAKSPWTKGHSERVSRYSVAIAHEMGLAERDIATLRTAALLHDIGKIGTYDYLLDKPESLTPEEYEIVKRHPVHSARILEPIAHFHDLIDVVRYHHERYDGKGYPDGLLGEAIPLMARILCVADSFDSMTADRPYRPAPGWKYALEEVRACSATHFDPAVVDAFIRAAENKEIFVDERDTHGSARMHR